MPHNILKHHHPAFWSTNWFITRVIS
jgi:hypothetical protein